MRLLIAAGIVAGLMASPAIAEDSMLDLAARNAVFVAVCPKHWERLPPRTQRVILAMGDDVVRNHDKETLHKAALEEYADGYDKQGERWCALMETVLTKAGNLIK